MPPWSSGSRRYFPILHVLQADLKGFRQLPKSDGSLLCPIIPLAQASGAHRLKNTLIAIRQAINGTSEFFIADLADSLGEGLPQDKIRDVHRDLQKLASADGNFSMWRKFIRENNDMVPVIRMEATTAEEALDVQVDDFLDLGRGMVIRLRPRRQGPVTAKAKRVIGRVAKSDRLDELLVVVDLEDIRESLTPSAVAEAILTECAIASGGKKLTVATAATSFPVEFNGTALEINEYPIVERQVNEQVIGSLSDMNIRVLYSDYGSARVRNKEKRGGPGYPRIDYATRNIWYSNRQKDGELGAGGYQAAAAEIMGCDGWIDDLNIYGANMIREAASGELEKRINATFWVGVRINLHLHSQAHYHASKEDLIESAKEDDWED
ncbi:hypothetical protein A6A40_16590 (plasmid) [Azospirillum humicireducens]|uniref:Uncharacterized protein n=1 Tax=Azospirillum humicireducens TaxID=1226968 RepID=A0A2R4VQH5_9PROT|nr:hypothetical protein [Azospirillum humicireducens]AWB06680.1 hypothetical protein A6A40_16590 [Azospirillum humicireducens]